MKAAPAVAPCDCMNPHTGGGPRQVTLDQSLRIGLPEIDRQHSELIDELNRLITDASGPFSTETLVDVLSTLGRDLAEHFRFEESLFGGLGMQLDEVDAHVAAHEEILSQYVDLNLDLMNKLRLLTRAEILAMVRRWVTGHILSYDLRMRELLAN